MPAPSWREKYRGGDKKATARVKAKKSKDQFAKWFQSKIKKGQEKSSQKKGRGFGQSFGGYGRGAGRAAGKGRGRGLGSKPEAGRGAPSAHGNDSLAVESGEAAGASKALVDRLMATKLRLLAGNAEAARAGAVRAEPGAWAAKAGRGSASSAGPAAVASAAAVGSEDNDVEMPSERWRGRGSGRGANSVGRLAGRGRAHSQSPGAGASSASATPFRTPAEREELFALNKKIDEHAKSKDLAAAKSVLSDLEERGWANAYTYATAVNAFCRCGDWQRAEEALTTAENRRLFRGGSGSSSGVVARTAMLRGYCEVARNLEKARQLLTRMEQEQKPQSRPNTRTANTFLRGCMQLGAVQDAEVLLKRMEEEWSSQSEGRAPDASSYETVVTLLCQALRYRDAQVLAERCFSKIGMSPGSGGMFVSAARAAAVCGDWKAVSTATKRARELLTKEEQSKGMGSTTAGSGGKRGKESGADADDARARSLEVFQSHRRAELLMELKEVDRFASKRKAADLKCLYMRTLVFEDFDSSKTVQECQAPKAADALCRRLSERFGLEPCGKIADAAKRAFEAALHAESLPPAKRRKKRRRQTSGGMGPARLNLAELFTASSGQIRPVHLELCSGGGEWLVAQAARDPSACWVACELRLDRSARCFQRIALHELTSPEANAGLIGGDAREALERRLAPASCARLFINHPEPPHQTDLEAAAASAPATHLLTADFLHGSCAAVLRQGGTLTICTDMPEYARWLLKTVAAAPLNEVFEDALKNTKADKIGRLDKSGAVRLRTVAPPSEICGAEYSGDGGASYFQRLKQSERGSRGQDEKRNFLCLRRL